MQVLKSFPALRQTALLMAYDNGGINRGRSEEEFEEDANAIIGAEGVYYEDLKVWDAWLTTLTEPEREIIADGEETERKALMVNAPKPEQLEALLLNIFENAV